MCLVQFLRGEGRGEEGSKIISLISSIIASPRIGGIWRGGEASQLNTILVILTLSSYLF
jgi:hypothetical protein